MAGSVPPDPLLTCPSNAQQQHPFSSATPPSLMTAGRAPSFATVLKQNHITPRFPPLNISSKILGSKEGKPSVSFSAAEFNAGAKRFAFSLIAKFTVGRPPIQEIQASLQNAWTIDGRATISEIWDGRHLLIILDSEKDVAAALSCPLRKVGLSLFRLFRWHPEYNPKKESSITTAWIRLLDLPLPIYDEAFIAIIVSTFGNFLGVDDRTKACLSVKYARVCVEIDAKVPIPDAVWVNLPNDLGYWQKITIESSLKYCSKCKIHGHDILQCRKVIKQAEYIAAKTQAPAGPQPPKDNFPTLIPPRVKERENSKSHVPPTAELTPSNSHAEVNHLGPDESNNQLAQYGMKGEQRNERNPKAAAKKLAKKAKSHELYKVKDSANTKSLDTRVASGGSKKTPIVPTNKEVSEVESDSKYNALGLVWKSEDPKITRNVAHDSKSHAGTGDRSKIIYQSESNPQEEEEEEADESSKEDTEYTSWTLVESRRISKAQKRRAKRLAAFKANSYLISDDKNQSGNQQYSPKALRKQPNGKKMSHKGVKQHSRHSLDV